MTLEFTDKQFQEVCRLAAEQYRASDSVRCPYFQDSVTFNARGFEHLRRKSWNRGRDQRDQFMRLKHISRTPEILRSSRTVQGIENTQEWERQHKHGRWEKLLVSVIYYEFVAVLDNRRFKVIVKQLHGRQRIFWILIPFWRQDQQGRRILHDGNPALD